MEKLNGYTYLGGVQNMWKLIIWLSMVAIVFLFGIRVYADNVVSYSEVSWAALNPARGDKSPQAGQLWGDRTKSGASGFLVRFVDGFTSPPHIHNVTYRGVVIHGSVHNDDPSAENLWLSEGSFWTQPAGGSHITSAKGENTMAYIEIEKGPYLVMPVEKAFYAGEKPVNIDTSNLVWLHADDLTWIDQEKGVSVAVLWGSPSKSELFGSFAKLPKGFSGIIKNKGADFRAIVIEGKLSHRGKPLAAGSFFGSDKAREHRVFAEKETVIYIRSSDKYHIY